MFLQRRRQCRAFANGIGEFENDGFERGILFFFAEAVQRLRNRNRRAEQRADFARQRRDVFAFDALAKRKIRRRPGFGCRGRFRDFAVALN